MSEKKIIKPVEGIYEGNFKIAQKLRRTFVEKGILALNLVSSPGSGKTTLLERTISDLAGKIKMAVIEGDQQTSRDAERIRNAGASAHQINTISGCHLDAAMVSKAIDHFDLDALDVLFIENVGNLVCPAAYDLGEDYRALVLSVTEGEDKPIKYPNMFMGSPIILANKIDLVSILEFDMDACLGYVRRVNADATVFQVSARSGEGLDSWYQWLLKALETKKKNPVPPVS